jgi:hypothetical protein
MKAAGAILSIIVFAIALIIFAAIIDRQVPAFIAVQNQALRNQAVQECFQNASYEYVNGNNAKVTEPIKSWYVSCLADKGYTSTIE